MADAHFEKDTFPTDDGDLQITFIGHGTLMLEFDGKVIHVDPYSRLADYSELPDADLILLTHAHRDHLDQDALKHIRGRETVVVGAKAIEGKLGGAQILANGERSSFGKIDILAVPAYNLIHQRDGGAPFHPKGEGNGYVLTLGNKRVYIAGDTEGIPEMKQLKDIDVAFLPMNLPYTMTPEMAASAAKSFGPKVLYPYHYGSTDPQELVRLLADTPSIEVRVRKMQ